MGVAIDLYSEEYMARIVIFSLAAAFFVVLGLYSAYDNFVVARRLWKEAELLSRIENSPKKKAPEENMQ